MKEGLQNKSKKRKNFFFLFRGSKLQRDLKKILKKKFKFHSQQSTNLNLWSQRLKNHPFLSLSNSLGSLFTYWTEKLSFWRAFIDILHFNFPYDYLKTSFYFPEKNNLSIAFSRLQNSKSRLLSELYISKSFPPFISFLD